MALVGEMLSTVKKKRQAAAVDDEDGESEDDDKVRNAVIYVRLILTE